MPSNTAQQNADVLSKRSALRRRIAAIRSIQAIYMPAVPRLLATEQHQLNTRRQVGSLPVAQQGKNDPSLPENATLFLPYQLSQADLDGCTAGLADMEERLRTGQMHDSLDKLRVQLHVKSRMVNFKGRHVRHQGPNTRIRKQLDVNDAKIIAFAEKYRAARRSKVALAGPGDWEREFRPLAREDVTTMTSDDSQHRRKNGKKTRTAQQGPEVQPSQDKPSEGKRKTSWIWMAADSAEDGDEAGGLRGMSDGASFVFVWGTAS